MRLTGHPDQKAVYEKELAPEDFFPSHPGKSGKEKHGREILTRGRLEGLIAEEKALVQYRNKGYIIGRLEILTGLEKRMLGGVLGALLSSRVFEGMKATEISNFLEDNLGNGLPDFFVSKPGVFFFLEIKANKSKISDKQREMFQKLKSMGCEVKIKHYNVDIKCTEASIKTVDSFSGKLVKG